MKKINGFTMAEVLITLGVIGVAAAVTLPAIIKNYNDRIIVERLRKSYNTLYNGIRMSEVDNGYMEDWPASTDMNVYDYYDKYFQPYFKGITLCKKPANCGYKNLDGSKWTGRNFTIVTDKSRLLFKLIDGTVVFYPRNSANTYINWFYVDVNGPKGPNVYEKDVFMFIRGTEKGIEPRYKALTIMKNGWKMP